MTRLETLLKEEFDDICRDIIIYMVINHVSEYNKKRYNELFREIKKFFKISKPTFNEHIQHLKDQKLVIREKSGKQVVHLYINHKNPMIKEAINMDEKLQKESMMLQAMKLNGFWENLPTYIAYYFAFCELRRVKSIFEYSLKPEKQKVNLLAMKLQDMLEEKLMLDLFFPLANAKSTEEQEKIRQQIITSLDKAIEETKNRMEGLGKTDLLGS